ncbi:NirA family protein [Planctomicrobium piriforme]|uniref:Ferredoxin-nitrite reductase n=1 Tax=Planctomicrobium piriforme TaxID=1576369 RepID=A0A1I3QHW4_9PLAN|nr:NirA family protein [Planctomicrobium piriforme]SFJ32891.1 ferredoxin-nitrite reductase [Planctomicrobium piriforme]
MSTTNGFTETQKNYLQGFAMGADVARKVKGLPILSGSCGGQNGINGTAIQLGAQGAQIVDTASVPGSLERQAQDRFLARGKKLSKEEQAKREKDALGIWDEMKQAARDNVFPKGNDLFLWKFHGLFHVTPAQNSFMCRLRIPGGELKSWQFRGIADLAEQHGGGFVDATTRANLQIREIPANRGCAVHEGLCELGLINKGSGADNIRNVTSAATAGFDPHELIDTLPLAKEMHHHILNHRELYGLPRKFNISFDGGGAIATLEDTNDIGFQAVRVPVEKSSVELPEGVYFRLTLGGITGHKDFARDTGVLLTPAECIRVAHAILLVFLENGDRTDRHKARLKYVLDDWGFPKFIEAVEKKLGRPLRKVTTDHYELPFAPDRWAHVDVHPQKQTDRYYIGLVLPVGRMSCEQVHAIADIADKYGSSRIRFTVWQNLIIPDIRGADVDAVKAAIEATGLDWKASSFRAGLVACTGNAGCKFAASNTKSQAMILASYLEERFDLDVPINMHFTGCPNSCAQHFIGDIGFRGAKVEVGEELVEGYEIVVGGGYADKQNIARQLFPKVVFEEIPPIVERLLLFYLENRLGLEAFSDFVNRHELEQLQSVCEFSMAAAS